MAGLTHLLCDIFPHVDDKRTATDLDHLEPASRDFRVKLSASNADGVARFRNCVAKLFEGVFHMFLQRLVADNHGLAWPLENIWGGVLAIKTASK